MRYFRTRSDPTLGSIADDLFGLHRTLGVLANSRRMDEETVQRYAEVFGATHTLVQALETQAGLEFGEYEMPFMWNTVRWSSEGATAGLLPRDGTPLPSDVLYSEFTGWAADAAGKYPPTRPLKAAIQHCLAHGFVAAVHFVVRLGRSGFVPAAGHRAFVLETLMRARAQVPDDASLVELLMPGFDAWTSAADIAGAEVDLSWMPDELDPLPPHPRCHEAVLHLLEYALGVVDDLRAASSLDEWTTRWASARGVLNDLMFTASLLARQPLALRSALGQLEETRADAFAYASMLMVSLDAGPPDGPSLLAAHRDTVLVLPHNLHGRLVEQRVLGPSWLPRDRRSVTDAPDRGWERLGLGVMGALAIMYPEQIHIEFPKRSRTAGYGEVRQDALDLLDELSALIGSAASDPGIVIDICVRGLEMCPWSAIFRSEMAIALDLTDRPQEALSHIRDAVVLDVANAGYWQSLSVVLGRLGHDGEARLAAVFSAFLADRERSDG